MKKINFIKISLDLIMGIIFALLFNKNVLGGLTFHEIAGLAMGFAVLVHILLNWKWVINVFKKIVKLNQTNKILSYVAKIAAFFILAFGIYSMVSVNYFSKTVQIFSIGSTSNMEHNKGIPPDAQLNGSNSIENQQTEGNNDTSKTISQGKMGGNPNYAEGGKARGSVNIFSVISSYLSIMGVFVVITYYFEKLISRRKVALV
ncbi:MAG: hypothetical protein AB6733_00955 [Clostridiaceae bacterium]